MYDFCIFNVPKMDLRAPSIGLSTIHSIVKNSNLKSCTFDFNILCWQVFVKNNLGHFWNYNNNVLVDSKAFDKNLTIIEPIFDDLLFRHIPKSKIIGISLFSIFSFVPLNLILKIVKKYNPNSKILLGGPGISYRNKKECQNYFKNYKKENLFDDFLYGEVDFTIVDYLLGKKNLPNLNKFVNDKKSLIQFSNTIPDYTDFNLNFYPKKHLNTEEFALGPNKWIYITGSKGCVRKCTFCDVKTYFGTYKTKTGYDIAKEMIHQHKMLKIDKFRFTDSLLNGNLKVLESMCETLLQYPHRLIWHGQYICRSSKDQNSEFYDLLANAGLDLVSIGIESGSESVRKHMKKNFSNESLYFTLNQLQRVKIKVVPLMMVGYPTETEEDFVETLNLINHFSKYKDIIVDFNLNNPTRILPGSPLELNKDNTIHFNSLDTDYDFTANWYSKNTNYTIRIERFFRFHNQLIKNNFQRSYAGGDFDFYKQEYIKQKNTNPDIIKMITKVQNGRYYRSKEFFC